MLPSITSVLFMSPPSGERQTWLDCCWRKEPTSKVKHETAWRLFIALLALDTNKLSICCLSVELPSVPRRRTDLLLCIWQHKANTLMPREFSCIIARPLTKSPLIIWQHCTSQLIAVTFVSRSFFSIETPTLTLELSMDLLHCTSLARRIASKSSSCCLSTVQASVQQLRAVWLPFTSHLSWDAWTSSSIYCNTKLVPMFQQCVEKLHCIWRLALIR